MRIRRTLIALAAAVLALLAARTTHGATAIHLPFPAGTAVSILQGYNGGTHQGVERYSLDLTRDDGKTSGSPALAPAPGTVVWSYPPGTGNGCVGIMIDGGDGLHEMLCHLILNHDYANGEHVGAAQVLGTVGAPGTVGNNGVAHIHLQLYRVVSGARTPVPFAIPDGVPLEGVSLPTGDGSFNEWACAGHNGPGCHIVSQGGAAAPATPALPAPPSRSGTITSAATSTTAGAALAAPHQQAGPLSVGTSVQVAGTGDCLRVHAQATTSAATVGCLPDGTHATITDGPQTADGYTWYKLDELGWSVADYLEPLGSNTVAAPPANVAQPAPQTSPAATPAAAAAPAATPDSSSSGTATAPAPAATPDSSTAGSTPAPAGSPSTSAGTPAPAPAPTAAPATTAPQPTPQAPLNETLDLGVNVVVTGTGDCLRIHDEPSMSSAVLDCLPDGMTAMIGDGPVSADGFTWWWLDGRGWVVADYLRPQ